MLADAGNHLLDALLWTTGQAAQEVCAIQTRLETGSTWSRPPRSASKTERLLRLPFRAYLASILVRVELLRRSRSNPGHRPAPGAGR